MPKGDRACVTKPKSKNAYVVGLRAAFAEGRMHALNRFPESDCPYRRFDMRMSFQDGYMAGFAERKTKKE